MLVEWVCVCVCVLGLLPQLWPKADLLPSWGDYLNSFAFGLFTHKHSAIANKRTSLAKAQTQLVDIVANIVNSIKPNQTN